MFHRGYPRHRRGDDFKSDGSNPIRFHRGYPRRRRVDDFELMVQIPSDFIEDTRDAAAEWMTLQVMGTIIQKNPKCIDIITPKARLLPY